MAEKNGCWRVGPTLFRVQISHCGTLNLDLIQRKRGVTDSIPSQASTNRRTCTSSNGKAYKITAPVYVWAPDQLDLIRVGPSPFLQVHKLSRSATSQEQNSHISKRSDT
jgi:hypothetical protein